MRVMVRACVCAHVRVCMRAVCLVVVFGVGWRATAVNSAREGSIITVIILGGRGWPVARTRIGGASKSRAAEARAPWPCKGCSISRPCIWEAPLWAGNPTRGRTLDCGGCGCVAPPALALAAALEWRDAALGGSKPSRRNSSTNWSIVSDPEDPPGPASKFAYLSAACELRTDAAGGASARAALLSLDRSRECDPERERVDVLIERRSRCAVPAPLGPADREDPERRVCVRWCEMPPGGVSSGDGSSLVDERTSSGRADVLTAASMRVSCSACVLRASSTACKRETNAI